MTAYQKDDQSQNDAEGERQPPADILGEDVGIEGEDRQESTTHRTQPVTAIDDQVDAAPEPAGDQLVDGGVDGRVLAADTEPGQEAEEEEPPDGEGDGGERGRREVDGESDQEELLTAVTVREPAEEESAGAGARHIERCRDARDLSAADRQAAAGFGEPAGDVPDDSDFQAVEDPDSAQADHDHPVPSRPRQAVQSRGDLCRDCSGDCFSASAHRTLPPDRAACVAALGAEAGYLGSKRINSTMKRCPTGEARRSTWRGMHPTRSCPRRAPEAICRTNRSRAHRRPSRGRTVRRAGCLPNRGAPGASAMASLITPRATSC